MRLRRRIPLCERKHPRRYSNEFAGGQIAFQIDAEGQMTALIPCNVGRRQAAAEMISLEPTSLPSMLKP